MVLRLFCAAGTKEAVTNSEAESSVAQTDMRDGGSFVLLPLDWGGGGGGAIALPQALVLSPALLPHL